MPIAVGSCLRGNVEAMIDSDSGLSSAAPTPCSARAAISSESLEESAHSIDDSVKMPSPTMNIRLRP